MFGIVSGEARRLPTTPAGRSPWVDRLLLALALSIVAALLASIALAVVNPLPSSAPAQQPVQAEGDVPAIIPAVPAAVDVPNPPVQDMPFTNTMLAFSEPLDWQFMETEIHSLYKDTRPLFMREFIGWFRTEDGSVRPIAEFTGNSMSDEDKLGASIDGIVFTKNPNISIDGARHWIKIEDVPPALDAEANAWGWFLGGSLRVGDKVVLYGGYHYFPEGAKINSTNWYRTEMPVATLEELSR